jgi:hypothetical protein
LHFILNKDDICKLQKKAGPEDFLESAGVVFQLEGGEFQSEGGKDVLQLNEKVRLCLLYGCTEAGILVRKFSQLTPLS